MKKMLIAGVISILACSAHAANFSLESSAPLTQAEVVEMYTASYAKKPKTITRGDRVIIVYDDGTTIIVDKDGSTTTVPPKP